MSATATDLGRFAVSAAAADVSAFRDATGLAGDGPALPLTFPMRWLVTPDVRAALVAMVPEPDLVLVHESQSFDYAQPLIVGGLYSLALAARRAVSPDRLVVDGTITATDGQVHATLETILRLFSTEAMAA